MHLFREVMVFAVIFKTHVSALCHKTMPPKPHRSEDQLQKANKKIQKLKKEVERLQALANVATQRQEILEELLRDAMHTANETEAENGRMRRRIGMLKKALRISQTDVRDLRKSLEKVSETVDHC